MKLRHVQDDDVTAQGGTAATGLEVPLSVDLAKMLERTD